MAEMTTLAAEAREGTGKGPARALRRTGRVPAVIYGEAQEQQLISLEARALRRQLLNPRFFSAICALELGGKAVQVLPREVQHDPVSDDPIHADFVRVSKGATIHVTVPVVFLHEDESPGIKRGGVLNIVRREVELTCPADSIPNEITLDLAKADIGDSLHISQIALPPRVEPTITDRDFTIATIAAPSGGVRDEDGEGETEGDEAG